MIYALIGCLMNAAVWGLFTYLEARKCNDDNYRWTSTILFIWLAAAAICGGMLQ